MAAVEDLKRAGATIVDPVARRARRTSRASAGRGIVRRLQVRHQPVSRVTRRTRAGAARSRRSSRSGSFIRRSKRGCGRRRKAARTDPTRRCVQGGDDYRDAFRAAVAKAMDGNKLDAFVYPTWSNPPRLIGDLNTPHGDNSQVFSPTTGWPAINVPMGYTRGTLPAGITFFGKAWSEADADQARVRLRAGDASSGAALVHATATLMTCGVCAGLGGGVAKLRRRFSQEGQEISEKSSLKRIPPELLISCNQVSRRPESSNSTRRVHGRSSSDQTSDRPRTASAGRVPRPRQRTRGESGPPCRSACGSRRDPRRRSRACARRRRGTGPGRTAASSSLRRPPPSAADRART